MREVFLDTSYAVALSSTSDQYHQRAIQISEQLEAESVRLITTRAVVMEIGNSLAKARYRESAVALLTALEGDPCVEIAPLSESLYEAALELYCQRPDKEWGLTDCVSFVLMSERGLFDALTADDHFRQAGFRPLLSEDA